MPRANIQQLRPVPNVPVVQPQPDPPQASDGLANAMWRGLISLWLSFCTLRSKCSNLDFHQK